MAPDGRIHVSMSEELEDHPQLKRATELLAVSLEQWVEGQQLAYGSGFFCSRSAGNRQICQADLPEYTAEWDSQAEVHPLRATSWPASHKKPAPSKELLRAVRVVFRTRVRPYLQGADESGLFSARSASPLS